MRNGIIEYLINLLVSSYPRNKKERQEPHKTITCITLIAPSDQEREGRGHEAAHMPDYEVRGSPRTVHG